MDVVCRKIIIFADEIREVRLHLSNSNELDCIRFALTLSVKNRNDDE